MKKVLILVLGIALAMVLNANPAKAGSDYKSFQEIHFDEEGNKFIHEYTEDDLKQYYDIVNSRKFMGWNCENIISEKKVKYVDETVFSCVNEGKTPVTYKISFKEEEVVKRSFSVTGSLGVELDGKIKKFKAGLDTKLKIEYSETSTMTKRSEWYAKLDVDTDVELTVSIVGEGYIQNGVAAKYVFWIRTQSGEYEIFTISTQYYRMEKRKI